MYIKVLIPSTKLAQAVTKSAAVLQVPQELSDYIAAHLTPNDWTYLRISQGQRVEIVRVISTNIGKLYVVRGVELTDAQPFGQDAILDYTPTKQEILDSVVLNPLILTEQGAVSIANGAISISAVSIVGLGGIADGLPIQERIQAICCEKLRDAPPIS